MKNIFIINLLMIILIFSIIEGSIRIFSNITPQGMSKDIINHSVVPTFNFANLKNKVVFGKKVFTDKDGFRITTKPIKRISQKDHVYFVGGSVTFGSGVDQKDTFSGILEKDMKNLNIINASVIGSNLENNFNIIDNKISNQNLKYIFINFSLDDIIGLNDVFENTVEDKNNTNQKIDIISKIKKNSIMVSINNLIRSKSVTYVFFKGLVLKSNEKYYQHALNSFKDEKNLKKLDFLLRKISQKNEILNNKINFLLIPYSYQINKDNCGKEDLAELIIEEKIKQQKIKLIKFKEYFCQNKNKEKIFLKYDPSHLSKYGHELVSKILKTHIK